MRNSRFLPYLLALVGGLAIMGFAILVLRQPKPSPGEYYWATLFRNHYGILTVALQIAAGFVLGRRFRPNPILIGLCLTAIFPITSIVEAAVYRGSHNMIPIELLVYFLWALPAMVASFLGGWLARQANKG